MAALLQRACSGSYLSNLTDSLIDRQSFMGVVSNEGAFSLGSHKSFDELMNKECENYVSSCRNPFFTMLFSLLWLEGYPCPDIKNRLRENITLSPFYGNTLINGSVSSPYTRAAAASANSPCWG
jgi:hypothetical protein